MVKKITIMDGVKSKVIYLYNIVIHTEAGQILVAQMITESHDTNSILFFLLQWTQSGAPFPNVVVCDGTIALLTAVIKAKEILKAILPVAYCQTDENVQGRNQFTKCEKQKRILPRLL